MGFRGQGRVALRAITGRLGITAKVTLVFVTFAATLLAAVSGLVYGQGQATLKAATVTELRATALEKGAALDDWVGRGQSTVAMIAAMPSLRRAVGAELGPATAPAAATRLHDAVVGDLRSFVSPGTHYHELFIIAASSAQIVASTTPEHEGQFREDRPYFIAGKRGPYTQNVYNALDTGGPAMTTAAPVRAASGQVVAVLAGQLDLGDMQALITLRGDQRHSDDAYLINTSSLFVTQPRLLSDPAVLARGAHGPAITRCLAHGSGTLLGPDYRGVAALMVYRWLPERQLCLMVTVDQDEAFAPVRAFGWTITLIGLVTLLVAIAATLGLARTITRPILALRASVVRFGRGDLAARLPDGSGDELGVLAREFNAMATAIADKEARLLARHQELEQANAELQQFAFVAAHDLREPLRTVISYVQLLSQRYSGALDPEADEFIGYAVEGATRMQTLVSGLLTYASIGADATPFAPTDLTALAQRAVAALQSVIQQTGAVVTCDTLPTVLADAAQLSQVLRNLLVNALTFHGAAPPRVHIWAERCAAEWRISVRDNGIGLDPIHAERIFVLFQRLHLHEAYPGSGLGLAVCKKIVERHGGHITVHSQPGQGATFTFTLPDSAAGPRLVGG